MRKKTSFVSSSLSVVPAPSSFACGLSLRATDNGPRTKDQGPTGQRTSFSHSLYSLFTIHHSSFTLQPALLSGPTSRTPADSTSSQGPATSPSPTPLQCCVTSRPATSPPATPLFRPTTSPFATPLLDQEGARGWLTARPAPGLRSG